MRGRAHEKTTVDSDPVQIRELKIPDSYEVTPRQFGDDRGVFLEWYRFDRLEDAVGHRLDLAQGNTSVSKRGVVRGIHFADIPPSQAKYVTATYGAVLDFVIDIRVGSPTFGQWDSVLLDDVDRRAIYIAEGLGHCFVALSDDATVSYLVTSPFNAEREHGVNPLDAEVGLEFGLPIDDLLLSPKDAAAPSLAEAAASGLLPEWEAARTFYTTLNERR
jgi:dTDP-4-dehydrorhamnose 3,5-epimerase